MGRGRAAGIAFALAPAPPPEGGARLPEEVPEAGAGEGAEGVLDAGEGEAPRPGGAEGWEAGTLMLPLERVV